MTTEPNHAHERIYGPGEPMELTYQPDEDDYLRWTLALAERITRESAKDD
jgi:hypothetical protein